MLQITARHKVLMAVEPVDFRKGIDGLRAMCMPKWKIDPFSGHVFVFRNKRSTSVKILAYDGNGFWVCQKRFSRGKLKWWPKTTQDCACVRAIELLIVLQQGIPVSGCIPENWCRLEP
jgi:transposase